MCMFLSLFLNCWSFYLLIFKYFIIFYLKLHLSLVDGAIKLSVKVIIISVESLCALSYMQTTQCKSTIVKPCLEALNNKFQSM